MDGGFRQGGLNNKPRVNTEKIFHTGGKKSPIAADDLLVVKLL